MANCADPDKMAHYEPSHQDLHCLHRSLVWSAGLKGLNNQQMTNSSLISYKVRLAISFQAGKHLNETSSPGLWGKFDKYLPSDDN